MFKRKSAFALDLGSSNIKVVQLKPSRRGVELERFASVPIFPSGRPDAETDLHMARVAAIQRALSAAKITTKNVISSISGDSIIVRYIQLPMMTEDELQNALRYEAEEYIPFPLDEVNLASHILGQSDEGNGKRINVLLVAAKKEIVAERVGLIREAGLTPHVVDVDSFALFNCYTRMGHPTPEDVVVLVDMGAEITNINICHEGTSHFARDIKIGGDTVTAALLQKLGVDHNEAESIKFAEGVHIVAQRDPEIGEPEEDSSLMESIQGAVEEMTGDDLGDDSFESQASRVIRNALTSLLTEIRRSLQFFENQVSGKPVNRMVISGGTAKLPNLDQFFAQELGIPVEVLDPLAGIEINTRTVDEQSLHNCREMLGVGIGLALREVA